MDPINIASLNICRMDNLAGILQIASNVHMICLQKVSLSEDQLQAKVAGLGFPGGRVCWGYGYWCLSSF